MEAIRQFARVNNNIPLPTNVNDACTKIVQCGPSNLESTGARSSYHSGKNVAFKAQKATTFKHGKKPAYNKPKRRYNSSSDESNSNE